MQSCTPKTVFTVAILLWLVVPAYGHAILLSATPALHAVVTGPNVTVELRFNVRVDQRRSRLQLLSSDGERRTLFVIETPSQDVLRSQAKKVPSGSYILRWQVLAGDGHISRGEVPFRVQ